MFSLKLESFTGQKQRDRDAESSCGDGGPSRSCVSCDVTPEKFIFTGVGLWCDGGSDGVIVQTGREDGPGNVTRGGGWSCEST